MGIRTTVELPEELHSSLKELAQETGTTMRAVVIEALESKRAARRTKAGQGKPVKTGFVTGPPIVVKGPLGPLFPTDENPYDLIFP